MEGGHMRLVEKEIQHLDLRWGRNEWSKLHIQWSLKVENNPWMIIEVFKVGRIQGERSIVFGVETKLELVYWCI
jgi:hypothetical protein